MKPAVLAVFSDNEIPIEERFSLADELTIRYGPDATYPIVDGAQALKGSRIFVLEEKDGWIRFRATKEAGTSVGWINKFASVPAAEQPDTALTSDVNLLVGLGLLTKIDAMANDATVDTNLWNQEDLPIQNGIGRALAFYCSAQKKSSTRWVEIRDSNTGKKIAKYSETMGFSSYLLRGEQR